MNLVVKKIENLKIVLDLNSQGISLPLYYHGGREKVFMNLLKEEIFPGDVCVDLGSNIGYTTMFMCDKTGNSGKVYAIEPDPYNISLLSKTLEINNFSNYEIFETAISNLDGKIDFWQSQKSNLSSVQKTKDSNKKIEVKCNKLGTFLEDKLYPNFLKMDIEGHEVKVFESGLDYFTKNLGRTKILLEVHPHFYNKDNDFEKILKEYFKIGFNSKYVVSTPVSRPKKFIEKEYEPIKEVHTDGFIRGLYNNISNLDLLEFSCRENIEGNSKKIVRSFMIERN